MQNRITQFMNRTNVINLNQNGFRGNNDKSNFIRDAIYFENIILLTMKA